MKDERPFIHLFRTGNGFYCYDAGTSSVIRLKEKLYRALEENKTAGIPEIESLKGKGYLQPRNDDITIVHQATSYVDRYLDEGMQQIILQLTQNCNLRCKYCVYSGSYHNRTHTNKRMNWETAKEAIDFYYAHSHMTDMARIGLYGGEPLLEFDLIKKIVEYSEKKFAGKELRINMTTNATLLTPEIVAYLQEHDFDLLVSLDGPRNVQDKSRVFADGNRGTFDTIMANFEMIQREFPEYIGKISFNAVIDTQNDFACSSDFFTYDFLKNAAVSSTSVSDRDADGDVSLQDSFYENYNYELFKGYLSYIGRIDKERVSKLVMAHKGFLMNMVHKHVTENYKRQGRCHPNGPCIAGANRLFVTVDGEFYPCERVDETSSVYCIGNLKDGFYSEQVKILLNTGHLCEDECRHCWAMNLCGICAADFSGGDKLSEEKKHEKCAHARREAEVHLKEYCTLREYGYYFDDLGGEA